MVAWTTMARILWAVTGSDRIACTCVGVFFVFAFSRLPHPYPHPYGTTTTAALTYTPLQTRLDKEGTPVAATVIS